MLHDKARNHITELDDEELANYIGGGTDLYSSEALEFARQELARRNVSPETIRQVEADANERAAFRNLSSQVTSSVPLGTGGKVAAFAGGLFAVTVFPAVIAFLVSQSYSSHGETRKSSDIWKWFGIGFLFWGFTSLMAMGVNRQ